VQDSKAEEDNAEQAQGSGFRDGVNPLPEEKIDRRKGKAGYGGPTRLGPVHDAMVLEGVFRLLWRAPGNGFAGFWEYRVEGAARRGD
jgi:hypothetical protein